MSTYYDIFAEVNVNGKWYGINPKMLKPNGMIIDSCFALT